jgi:hypothetical protein
MIVKVFVAYFYTSRSFDITSHLIEQLNQPPEANELQKQVAKRHKLVG